VGSIATDTLTGPVALLDQTLWTITGVNAGAVDGTAFAGFENLTGQNATSDAFVFDGGSVTGTFDGGSGLHDGFATLSGGTLDAFQPAGNNAAGSSAVGQYAGMDRYSPFNDSTPLTATDNLVVNGT